jgi:hypothetical protein
MKILNLSLPHPVLGLNDDVSGEYTPNIEAAPTEDFFIFKVNHNLKNDAIERLIYDKKAQFCVEINCPATVYRRCFVSYDSFQEIKISQEFLRNKFEVTFFITATQHIPNYSNDSFSYDYEGSIFDIEEGDVIAYGGETKQFAVKDWLSLKSIKSFMTIKKDLDSDGNMSIQLSPDKIIVMISEEDYKKYCSLIGTENISSIFHSSIVFPALIYTLNQMADPNKNENYENYSWYEYLLLRKENDTGLQQLDWTDQEHIVRIAQKILNKPINRLLEAIEKQNKDLEEIITE